VQAIVTNRAWPETSIQSICQWIGKNGYQRLTTYRISSDHHELNIPLIHDFISHSYWGEGIPRAIVEKAIKNSLCFGVFAASGEQVGFARVITDRATFAYLADVFILEPHRGKGLSKQLMQHIALHPDLQGLRRMMLATRDAHGLYAACGFKPLANPDTFMEIWNPAVYQKRAV
jgi:N-acetylglutamate synthase-like GNAT family acetyltransferase